MRFRYSLLALALVNAGAAMAAEETTKELDKVVTTATLSAEDTVTVPAFATVITSEDISKSPLNSLADLLRDTVGVNNQTGSYGQDEIQIRGMDGTYTLILINGKRTSSKGALWRGGDFDYSSIPLSSIERVEIIRGPMAALYGSDAIGGVINIITKKPTQQWTGSVTAEQRVVASGDQGDQYRIGASASGALTDRVSLAVSGEYYEREPWYSTTEDDITHPMRLEEKKAKNLATTLSMDLTSNQTLDLDLTYENDKRPYNLISYAYYPAWDYTSLTYSSQEINRLTYALTHKGNWGWGDTTFYVKQENGDIEDYSSSYDAPQHRDLEQNNTYAKAYVNFSAGDVAVTTGVDYSHEEIKDPSTYLSSGEISTDQLAAFAQGDIGLTDKLHLTLGGRLDNHETFGSHFSPKGYLVYEISDGVAVKGGVSTAFKAPGAYQLSEEYSVISCGGSCYLAGNPDLDPETSVSYEAGIEINKPTWDLSAAVFQNDVDDMIVAYYDSSVPSREWINVASAKTSGLELSGSVDVTSAFSVSGNMTLLDTEYTDAAGEKTELDLRPEQQGNLSLDLQMSDDVSGSLSASYYGKQYNGGEELPSYTRLDLGLTTHVSASFALKYGIKNLTDVNLDKKDEGFTYYELGRNYYLSGTYSF